MADFIKKFLDYKNDNFTVSKLIWALFIFGVCLIAMKFVLRFVRRSCQRGKLDDSYTGYIVTVAKIALYFVAIIICLDIVGVPISSFLAVLSVAGLALSLSVQDLLSNLISGFVIVVTKPFGSDDYVEIADKSGRVAAIGFMHTTLLTPDNKTIYIPNHEICATHIVNYTREPTRRVDIKIGVSYDNNAEEVKNAVQRAFRDVGDMIYKDPAPFVGLNEYGASSVNYVIRVWCDNGNYWDVYYKLNELIREKFNEDGIEITYDHINVHMIDDKNKGDRNAK
ncbi:MAG: mechanosensitive ion channel family protein [Ruminococcaceae bacterium]|nr:mechanosensitive ion channel family protein [Oscillospiraceae bacterium]